jgi:hypothetical protein
LVTEKIPDLDLKSFDDIMKINDLLDMRAELAKTYMPKTDQ